jgi:hypothetical protein
LLQLPRTTRLTPEIRAVLRDLRDSPDSTDEEARLAIDLLPPDREALLEVVRNRGGVPRVHAMQRLSSPREGDPVEPEVWLSALDSELPELRELAMQALGRSAPDRLLDRFLGEVFVAEGGRLDSWAVALAPLILHYEEDPEVLADLAAAGHRILRLSRSVSSRMSMARLAARKDTPGSLVVLELTMSLATAPEEDFGVRGQASSVAADLAARRGDVGSLETLLGLPNLYVRDRAVRVVSGLAVEGVISQGLSRRLADETGSPALRAALSVAPDADPRDADGILSGEDPETILCLLGELRRQPERLDDPGWRSVRAKVERLAITAESDVRTVALLLLAVGEDRPDREPLLEVFRDALDEPDPYLVLAGAAGLLAQGQSVPPDRLASRIERAFPLDRSVGTWVLLRRSFGRSASLTSDMSTYLDTHGPRALGEVLRRALDNSTRLRNLRDPDFSREDDRESLRNFLRRWLNERRPEERARALRDLDSGNRLRVLSGLESLLTAAMRPDVPILFPMAEGENVPFRDTGNGDPAVGHLARVALERLLGRAYTPRGVRGSLQEWWADREYALDLPAVPGSFSR